MILSFSGFLYNHSCIAFSILIINQVQITNSDSFKKAVNCWKRFEPFFLKLQAVFYILKFGKPILSIYRFETKRCNRTKPK